MRGQPDRPQVAGFTLIEVMLVLALTSLIGLILIRWHMQQESSLRTLDSRLVRQERQSTAIAYLRQDLAKADTLIPALSDVTAGPNVLITARHYRDTSGYATSDSAYTVYQLQQGQLRRTLIGSDESVLAQPVGQLPTDSSFQYLDEDGRDVGASRSHGISTIQIAGFTLRLGGGGNP